MLLLFVVDCVLGFVVKGVDCDERMSIFFET